uniref:Chloroplast photosystem II 5 kDa protein n=1 Tax=Picrorhiza kurrooa TaxID=195120 RepID=B6DMH2_9LAMI|nr:chloroplast photosystem II 5 kDa precursor protein [Picrorhiza kurrooa]
MASVTMTTSFFCRSAAAKQLPTTGRGGVAMVRASKESEKLTVNVKEESNNTRRDLMFAMAAVVASSIANFAMADEPKRGTVEAKKKYAAVCVTNPTARICKY